MGKAWQVKVDPSVLVTSKAGAARGLRMAAEYGLEQSNRHVPIEEGTLERSGVASVDEQNLRAAVSYDTPYAVVQHEDMTLHHDAGRSAKYLENALNGSAKEIAQIIADEIRKGIKG
jgi:hypothetical protein